MARTVSLHGHSVKLRRPWVCFLLALVTLGIYYLYWYYVSNRDLQRDGTDVDPVLATLAISIGGLLIIPPFVSQWRFYKRIREAQKDANLDPQINHVLGFVLYLLALILLPFEIPYAQSHLNRLWEHKAGEEQKAEAGLRG
jgi:membrane protease YdiL (CAAX protease family)